MPPKITFIYMEIDIKLISLKVKFEILNNTKNK